MSTPQTYDAGIAHHIGRYSDAIRVPAGRDQIIVSGTPGLDENGAIPADFADEARQAWRNVATILGKSGASVSDMVVDALVWPAIHVEIEVVALVPPGSAA